MKPNLRRLLQVGAIAVGVFIAVFAGFVLASADRFEHDELTTLPALVVHTMAIQSQPGFDVRRLFSGRVQARRDSLLGFEQSGALAIVHVREGKVVQRGELLAELDTERLQAQRAELTAALAEAEANLALAEATLKRTEGVLQSGGVSRQGLDEARQGRRAARAAVDLARRRIGSVDVEFAKTQLAAPFEGTIVARLADEGQVLATGRPVLRLQSIAAPEIRIGVAGNSVDTLRVGQVYTLEWRGRPMRARLRAVLPLRAATSRTVDALLDPLEPPAELRPGDLVSLRLSTPVEALGIWIPITALAEGERGLWSVYVAQPISDTPPPAGLSATHRVVRRTVDVIHQEAGRVYVRGTLRSDDRVVAAGLHRIVPGQYVRQARRSIVHGSSDHD